MPTLELETMRCVVDGSLGRLHLNRPEALNAANWAWVRNLVQAVDFLKEHEEVHVVIVSGEGRSFCSGLDVKELSEGNLSVEWFDVWEQGVSALANLPAITIAAIQGYCLGGGLQLAVACDLLVASTDAILSIPAVKEGVVADLGPMRLARLIGASKAKYLSLLGRRFSAKEGLELGIIHEVVEPGELQQQVLSLAQELLGTPFTALKHTKRQINMAFELDLPALTREMVAAQDECLRSPEHAVVMETYRATQAERRRQKEGQR
jgi:enoyl-CoA hydratase/carnithine racemase